MRRTAAVLLTLALSFATVPAYAHPAEPAADRGAGLDWAQTVLDSDQSFRGLDAVSRRTAWVTGESTTDGPGSVWRTTDGGDSWQNVSPPESDGLLFRDVEALGARSAVVLAIGPGEASRIYRTADAGKTWHETFRNRTEQAFFNCVDFYPGGRRGLAVSDPVDGKFRILSTDDGGRSWSVQSPAGMPDSTGEANFSASGDCLVIRGHNAWFGSGGSAARVFRSSDLGRTWTASDSTIPAGEAAGVFGLAFRTPWQGVAVGGDFDAPADGGDASAYTGHERTWTNGGDLAHLGEDAAWVSVLPGTLVVVGESGDTAGSSISHDGGRSWTEFSKAGFHTLDCTIDFSCWAAGGDGRVGRLQWRPGGIGAQ
ncbi:WD40/YVTN/BNR-like repeat-containing protein [Solicola gregarius]|uniref:Oxidoreductase n=1 Tax=Solicola gregarius TaxID=2908642 RepID=A0AA46YNN8_9ACTN|nr:oxidoreductase [Solicola gregarius]UYM07676.1 oxidoreductase [Solicola gregarius]